MNRIAKYATIVTVAGAMFPLGALAVTIPSVQFSNSQATIDCNGGSTVNATFYNVDVGSGEVIEYVRTQVGSEPFVDTSVGGTLGLQEASHDITASVKCPPNTGTYTLAVQTAGTFGGMRSINGGDNVNGGTSFGGAIRVVANASTPTPSTPSWFDQIMALITGLEAKITALTNQPPVGTPTPPAPSGKCAELNVKMMGAQKYGRNQINVQLQGYLLSEGMSIPALAAGASFGFYGDQTQSAINAFKGMHNCY